MPGFWENDALVEPVTTARAPGKGFWENDPVVDQPASGGFDAGEYARFKANRPAGGSKGFNSAEYEEFKARTGERKGRQPNPFDQFDDAPAGARGSKPNPFDQFDLPAASAPAKAMSALAPFFDKGLSTRNSAGQWTPEARARLTREGINPLDINTKAEKGLLATYQAQNGQQTGDEAAAIGRGLINGVPVVGPALLGGTNRAAAFIRAVQNGTSYTDELKNVEDFNTRTAAANPGSTTTGELAGGVLGTAPAVMAAPAAFGAGAGSLALRSGLSAATSGVLGGADAAIRSGGDLEQTGEGAALGGGLGLIAPGAGQALGSAIKGVAGLAAKVNPNVPGVGNRAARALMDDMRNSGGAEPVRARLDELGPEAMLLDASPSFEGRAQSLAVRPETREAITAPLTERAQGANRRLTTDVDTHLGPNMDPAVFHAELDRAYDEAVPQLYQRALSRPVTVDTSDLLATVGRMGEQEKGGAQSALQRAWGLLHTEGDVPGVGSARVPDRRPEALHNAKEALDAQIAAVRNQQGSAARSELRALTTVRSELNAALEAQVPGYADANRMAQSFFQQREAFDRGQTLLNGGREAMRPAEVAETTAALSPEAQQAQRLGLRTEVDRLTGTQLNDRLALRKALLGEGDYNRSRMGTVFGEEPTAGLASAVDREAAFDASHQRIVNNSMTELRRQAADAVGVRDLSPNSGPSGLAVAGGLGGAAGIAGALGLKGLKLGADVLGRSADLTRNKEAARILTLKAGPERDALIETLTARLTATDHGAIPANKMENFVRQVLQSQNDRSERNLPSPVLGQ
ncbi:hypothetical protein [Methylobacterium planeticum]|uniref:Uncharacterized protein n=1 Tax=Methylobacterium planeticum TaxID=2615211 RepID=A0A6N6MQ82_9HYPH|nr:hypothetical protein [Methylobacterium planeticum]KAB1072178.1 hypothetical protein F6X51_17300 [Methylobacterium planeticum]